MDSVWEDWATGDDETAAPNVRGDQNVVTEDIVVVTLRLNRAEAAQNINRLAQAFNVTIDRVRMRGRLFNIEFRVTVTGAVDQVEALHDALGGRAVLPGGNPVDWVLNDLAIDQVKQAASARRARSRKHADAAPEGEL